MLKPLWLGWKCNAVISMQSRAPHPELDGWQRFIGRWATQATHPLLPGTVVRGNTTFEWLDGRRFLINRWAADQGSVELNAIVDWSGLLKKDSQRK